MPNPKQNRVNPKGELVAHASQGMFMGNRGILHDAHGAIGHQRWRHKAWIICLTAFKGRKRRIMAPNSYTELFFLDEATALAAGHRPCAECRRRNYTAYRMAVERGGGVPAAEPVAALDRQLHSERALPRRFRQKTWRSGLADLPDGAMFEQSDGIYLVMGDHVLEWSFQGYGNAACRREFGPAEVSVLTPRTSVAALSAGYIPAFHPSADPPLT